MQITLNGKNYEIDSYKIHKDIDGEKTHAEILIAWEVIEDKTVEAPLVEDNAILEELAEIVFTDDRFEVD